eukprot:514639-Amphidinium_carterae.2
MRRWCVLLPEIKSVAKQRKANARTVRKTVQLNPLPIAQSSWHFMQQRHALNIRTFALRALTSPNSQSETLPILISTTELTLPCLEQAKKHQMRWKWVTTVKEIGMICSVCSSNGF